MITVTQLRQLNVYAFESFAEAWSRIDRNVQSLRTDFTEDVLDELRRDKWRGEGGKAAEEYAQKMVAEIDALDTEIKSVRRFLDETADGGEGRGGMKGLVGLQRDLGLLTQEILENDLHLADNGDVTWTNTQVSNDPSPAQFRIAEERSKMAQRLSEEVKKVLSKATEVDKTLTYSLKVIFGTVDNFDTEDRKHGVESPDWHDRWVKMQLMAVVLWLDNSGKSNAAGYLKAYLDGEGKPRNADVNQMLADMPAFRRDVDTTLKDVRKGPNGVFTTEWGDSAPNLTEGPKSLDWYYAFNNFEYRLVGTKNGDEIEYQVEVRKRYDWGIPSEHRRNPEGAGINLEQADIAHLNRTGLARDFDVSGRSGPITVRN
ncbi:hypothetical protein SRB5_39320 [Streptomyces sp. RB5]|uniref:Uncharacterized protein n=1 Tax=Streptomyces smaragdinus TaxID=2585196 RepID=A0A7K0CJX7_9ACTN|nr:hypothetical protein [Streptomyces smaragdinus]MQY13778.1 hypothetical protein [Streptomyces smaragdinus]